MSVSLTKNSHEVCLNQKKQAEFTIQMVDCFEKQGKWVEALDLIRTYWITNPPTENSCFESEFQFVNNLLDKQLDLLLRTNEYRVISNYLEDDSSIFYRTDDTLSLIRRRFILAQCYYKQERDQFKKANEFTNELYSDVYEILIDSDEQVLKYEEEYKKLLFDIMILQVKINEKIRSNSLKGHRILTAALKYFNDQLSDSQCIHQYCRLKLELSKSCFCKKNYDHSISYSSLVVEKVKTEVYDINLIEYRIQASILIGAAQFLKDQFEVVIESMDYLRKEVIQYPFPIGSYNKYMSKTSALIGKSLKCLNRHKEALPFLEDSVLKFYLPIPRSLFNVQLIQQQVEIVTTLVKLDRDDEALDRIENYSQKCIDFYRVNKCSCLLKLKKLEGYIISFRKKQYDQGYLILLNLIKEYENIHPTVLSDIFDCYYFIGKIFVLKNQKDNALQYFTKCDDLIKCNHSLSSKSSVVKENIERLNAKICSDVLLSLKESKNEREESLD
jgi:hypothetical protein